MLVELGDLRYICEEAFEDDCGLVFEEWEDDFFERFDIFAFSEDFANFVNGDCDFVSDFF